MGSGDPAADHLGLLRTPGALFHRVAMACDATATVRALRPWLVDLIPLLVVLLIAAHVLILVRTTSTSL
uniref:Uncharacterized protein n=1 Tax=Arundo donax TaxID=35708 RepID=A0A0A9GNX5_ARUDO